MLIPIGTDAPVYHFPISTIGLIVTNAIVYCFALFGDFDPKPFCLRLGDGLHPVQWVTHAFLHAGPVHLLGNMIFLWCFGLIVEGKLGWSKFLSLYLVIAAVVGLIVQVIMLPTERNYALGASSAIFGVMVIAAMWAPKNDVTMVWILFYRLHTIEVSILMVAFWYLGWDVITFTLTDFSMSSAALHLLGG